MSKPHIKVSQHEATQQADRPASQAAHPKWVSPTATGIRLTVQISPNAKKTEVVTATEDTLKIRLHAPPVDGKANEALIRFVSDKLNLPKSAVDITHGHTSRRKLLDVRAPGLMPESVGKMLTPAA